MLRCVKGIGLAFAFVFVVGFLAVVYGVYDLRKLPKAQMMQIEALDHYALLGECRTLMSSWSNEPVMSSRSPSYSLLPSSIRRLRPDYVLIIRDESLSLVWHSGIWECGVHAYPGTSGQGRKELIPGLWLFCDKTKK